MEKGPRGLGSGDIDRGATKSLDPPGDTARRVDGSPPCSHGSILQSKSPAINDASFVKGIAPLGDADRPVDAGRHSSRVRLGMPEAKKPRELFKGSDLRCLPESGAHTARKGVIDYPDGDPVSWTPGRGGAEDPTKDKVYGQRSRSGAESIQGQQRQGKRRWKEGAWRRQRKQKRKGRREGEGGLRGLRRSRVSRGLKGEEARQEWQSGNAEVDKGVLGSIGSRSDVAGVAGSRSHGSRPDFASGREACLPKGGLEPPIQPFEKFQDVLGWAWDALKSVRNRMRRQLTLAKGFISFEKSKDCIFPLPASQDSSLALRSTVSALNDLSGYDPVADEPDQSASPLGVQKNLERLVNRFEIWDTMPPEVSFEKLFTSKTLDYVGEEVKIAQRLKWSAVAPSLPEGVGLLPLEDFCRLGTLHYIQHFTDYLWPDEVIQVPRAPTAMVEPESWGDICKGLVERNICEVWPVDHLVHFGGVPLLNGLFAVGKGEFHEGEEIQRLIMNLTPVNSLCQSLKGDVGTLPSLAGFSGFLLEENEVALLSSEDIRCFFYLFSIPDAWKPYMGFNREVPATMVPESWRGQPCVLVSRVLPMGFLNSVAIAKHIHRNITRWSATMVSPPVGGEGELRKDLGMSSSASLYRVYLDNFDQVERHDRITADMILGVPSAQVLKLRQDYLSLGLPRHPKKAVERQYKAEIQGALFNGLDGFAMPKVAKVWQYALLAVELLTRGTASLKELQVVAGGFVYMCMFRRPLLCSLNGV